MNSRAVRDVIRPGQETGEALPPCVDLVSVRVVRIPLTRIAKVLSVLAALVFFATGSVSAPHLITFAAPDAAEERAALEAQLRELERQISDYEAEITEYRRQGNTLKNEISTLNSKIAKINLQIRAVRLSLQELDNKIADTQSKISVTEEDIERNRNALAGLLQAIYESDATNLLEIFLQRPRLSDFFNDVNSNLAIQENLQAVIGEISALRDSLVAEKEELAVARADAEEIRVYHDAQRKEAEQLKGTKNTLLVKTQGKESEYQTLLKQTKETASQIRSRLFRLLGGGELTFEQAYQYAKLAGDAAGVRPSLILAVLDRESALGRNVGQCAYNQVMSATGRQTMHPTRDEPVFLEIMRELGVSPSSVTVSCPNSDGTYGGAMGPAQFIPSTWKLYAGAVSRVTGEAPANPWRHADAFVATALYLSDSYNSRSCREYATQIPNEQQVLRERCAAAQYYAGGNWYRFRWAYGEPVVQRANRFEDDITVIAG